MKSSQQSYLAIISLFFLTGMYACQQPGGESTGSELIPDMAHSIAYEANVNTEYSLNSWDNESVVSRRELSKPRLPVKGTIPRGYSGMAINDGTFENANQAIAHTMSKMSDNSGVVYTPNGSVPYYYPDTEDGRNLAMEQIKYNPFPITQTAIANGQELYNYYCGLCHGDKGEGDGYLVRDNGGKYPAQPANFILEEFVNASNGRYYHSIMFGKNAMGAYADKLSYEERWNVIHYIRSLQAKSLKVKYNHETNQLNPDFGVPQAMVKTVAEAQEEPHSEETTSEGNHSQGHGSDADHGH